MRPRRGRTPPFERLDERGHGGDRGKRQRAHRVSSGTTKFNHEAHGDEERGS